MSTEEFDDTTADEREPTAAEIDWWRRENLFIKPEQIDPEFYPRMVNMSAGFMARATVRPDEPEPPEYIAIEMPHPATSELLLAVAQWNLHWEAAQFRRRFFDEDDLPEPMRQLSDLGDNNLVLVPRTRSRYFEYQPLAHLLPRATLERFGLPLLRSGQWPFIADNSGVDDYLPDDFEQRLARAWAWTVWPRLSPKSSMSAFTKDDPVRILAHNLDFWVPTVTRVIENILREFPEVKNDAESGPVRLVDGSLLEGAQMVPPRMGRPVWLGDDEAAEKVIETVEQADVTGRLHGILDAVRSNRVEDDFSDRWSFAREDFERKMYRKRSRTRVRFVELTDTFAVQGPESEVLGAVVTNDFLALLDERNRQIVVLLNSGVTKRTEIADILGYANHSPVSKRLIQIQRAAAKFFDDA
jgi:hypothetical protein